MSDAAPKRRSRRIRPRPRSSTERTENLPPPLPPETERRKSARGIALGVLAKGATALPRSVRAGGWSPLRDVYGCVVAKWLHATESVRGNLSLSPLRLAPTGSKTLRSSGSPGALRFVSTEESTSVSRGRAQRGCSPRPSSPPRTRFVRARALPTPLFDRTSARADALPSRRPRGEPAGYIRAIFHRRLAAPCLCLRSPRYATCRWHSRDRR